MVQLHPLVYTVGSFVSFGCIFFYFTVAHRRPAGLPFRTVSSERLLFPVALRRAHPDLKIYYIIIRFNSLIPSGYYPETEGLCRRMSGNLPQVLLLPDRRAQFVKEVSQQLAKNVALSSHHINPYLPKHDLHRPVRSDLRLSKLSMPRMGTYIAVHTVKSISTCQTFSSTRHA